VRRFTTGFPVRCTDEEKLAITARAENANRSLSRFLVELALLDAESEAVRTRSAADSSTLEALIVQLRRLIGTLNELLRDPALADPNAEPTAERVTSAITDVEDLIAELWAHLV
jgi:hypothetical protein